MLGELTKAFFEEDQDPLNDVMGSLLDRVIGRA